MFLSIKHRFPITFLSCCCISLLLGTSILSFGQVVNDEKFSTSWRQFVNEESMPGCVFVLATPSEVISVQTVGYADIASQKQMTENSFFWIASNTKAIVAAAVMICVEDGLVDLDVPLDYYLPQLSNLRVERPMENGALSLEPLVAKPTLRQALSHTAGFRFITRYQESYGIDSLPVQRLMTTVGMTPLIEQPGKRYSYSNLGIDVAQAVVEVVTKRPFEEFLKERVFVPLEMNDTTFYPNEEQFSRLATVYGYDGNKQVLVPVRFGQLPSLDDGSPRFAEGGGGLFSSALDLVKFYQMLGGKGKGANGVRVLSEKSVEEMTKKQTGETVSDQYGFGLSINERWFGHGGAFGTQGVVYFDGSAVGVYLVAVAGLPKQTEAENVFRQFVEKFSAESKK